VDYADSVDQEPPNKPAPEPIKPNDGTAVVAALSPAQLLEFMGQLKVNSIIDND
jgi:hypothetical protein